jgi:hypothetical protein
MIFPPFSLALLLVSVLASQDLVATLDPATNAAMLRFNRRLKTSLTTFAMESAAQELLFTLGVQLEEDGNAKDQQKTIKKKAIQKSGSNGY